MNDYTIENKNDYDNLPADLNSLIDPIVEAANRERGYNPENALLSRNGERERIKLQLEESAKSVINHVKNAVILSKEEFSNIKDSLDPNLALEFEKIFQENIEIHLDKFSQNKLNDFFGISDSVLQVFYQIAKSFYLKKQYEESSDILYFLCILNPSEPAYWKSLGNAYFLSNEYQKALNAYFIAFNFDPEDMDLLFYAARCNEAQEDWDKAIECIDFAIENLDKNNSPNLIQAKEYKNYLEKKNV